MDVDTDNLRKAINFDIEAKRLKDDFGITNEYQELSSFFLEHGFEHAQYSGYQSIEPMTDADIRKLARVLANTFEWIPEYVSKMHVTTIVDEFDLLKMISKDFDEPETPFDKSSDCKSLEEKREEIRKIREAKGESEKSHDVSRKPVGGHDEI